MYSNKGCSDNGALFPIMFPDSKITSSFWMGPTKLKYLTNFGMTPNFKSLLVEKLRESAYYIVSFDKIFNDMLQSCEMVLLGEYFHETDFMIQSLNFVRSSNTVQWYCEEVGSKQVTPSMTGWSKC